MKSTKKEKNPLYASEMTRINRAIGQLEGIKRMINADRYYVDILIQFKATRYIIRRIENSILKMHLGECLDTTFKDTEAAEKKLIEIKKTLDRILD